MKALWLPSHYNHRVESLWKQLYGLQSWKYLWSSPLQNMFAHIWFKRYLTRIFKVYFICTYVLVFWFVYFFRNETVLHVLFFVLPPTPNACITVCLPNKEQRTCSVFPVQPLACSLEHNSCSIYLYLWSDWMKSILFVTKFQHCKWFA